MYNLNIFLVQLFRFGHLIAKSILTTRVCIFCVNVYPFQFLIMRLGLFNVTYYFTLYKTKNRINILNFFYIIFRK